MENSEADDAPSAKEGGAGSRGSQTLLRGLDILDQVLHGPVRLADLSRSLDLTKSTTYRLVQALKARDFLSATDGGYALGPKLLQLGTKAHGQTDYVKVARPFMEALSAETGHCVFVGKRDGDYSLHLERVTGRQRLTVSTVPGDRRFITDTGIGKALLLDDEDAELIRLLKRKDLGRGAQAAWIKRMHEHQDRGAVINQSEVGDGVNSVAAPVRDARGEIVVALSIAGASIYLGDDVMRQLAAPVRASAALISSALGYKERGRSA